MISARLAQLSPYTPGEQPRDRSYVKLNTNENPYPPDPDVEAYFRSFDADRLRRYPDPLFTDLRAELAEHHGVPADCFFVGNGSDEVLAFAFFAFFDSNVVMSEHTYTFYPVYCSFFGISSIIVPQAADLSVDLEAFPCGEDTGGVVLANPNSPTGTYIEPERLRRFLDRYRSDRVVIVDEAYIDFGGESCLSLINRYDNLLVVRTMSKGASLAGLRLGYACGSPNLVKALFTAKDSFNSYPVGTVAQDIGRIVVRNATYYRSIQARVVKTRERCTKDLRSLGWRVLPSKANFIFASHPSLSGEMVYNRLKNAGVLVRYFCAPRLSAFVRITVGTDREMDILISAVEEEIDEKNL